MRSTVMAVTVLSFAAVSAGAAELTVDEVLEAHCAAREQLVSLRAGFTQTKVFTLFDETEESSGEFVFLEPDMLSWRFTSPDTSITVVSGGTAWTVLPRIKQVQKASLRGSSTDRIMSIIGFGSCGEAMREDFDISLEGGEESLILLDLVPLSDDISPYFSLIVLGLDAADYLPRRIVFHEHSGDLLVFEFDRVEPGARVDPEDFEFTVPEGYEVVEY